MTEVKRIYIPFALDKSNEHCTTSTNNFILSSAVKFDRNAPFWPVSKHYVHGSGYRITQKFIRSIEYEESMRPWTLCDNVIMRKRVRYVEVFVLPPVNHTNSSPFLLGYRWSLQLRASPSPYFFHLHSRRRIASTLPRVEQTVLGVSGSAAICQATFRSFFDGPPFLDA